MNANDQPHKYAKQMSERDEATETDKQTIIN